MQTKDDKSLIRFENVSKAFGDFVVFKNLNLKIAKGKINFIIGRSGSGKSVMLKHVLGFLHPDKGDIYIDDINTKTFTNKNWQSIRKRFGILFQDSALFDSMSVFDNVAFPIREHTQKTASQINETVKSKLNLVGLGKHYYKMPSELSGGMKKRVALARAIALDPELVLFDEPSSGLDPIVSSVVDKLILDIKAETKSTFLVISHDMKATLNIADKVAMLYDGQIVFDGSKEALSKSDNPLVKQFVNGQLDGPFNIFY